MIESFVREIDLSAIDLQFAGWRPHQQFLDATASLSSMGCHYSQLSAGHSPHPPHAHVEEELLIILDGEADLVVASSPDDPSPRVEQAGRGKFVYYPAWLHHTIRNNSGGPVTYLMFKWSDPRSDVAVGSLLPDGVAAHSPFQGAGFFDVSPALNGAHGTGFSTAIVFEHGTPTLNNLHCHLTKLAPGAGYPAHADPYDVAIVLLQGSITINGQAMAKAGVAYFSAGALHDMHNPGDLGATYLVFEFHPPVEKSAGA